MRTFPPRRAGTNDRRRVLVALVTCVLVSIPLTTQVANARKDPLKHRKHQVHQQVHHARSDVEDSSKSLARANQRLSRARSSLRAAEHRLAGTRTELGRAAKADARMRVRLAQAQQRLDRARTALRQGQARVADQKQRIADLASRNYQYGDPRVLGLVAVLKTGTPGQITTQINTVRNLVSRESWTLRHLKDLEAQLRARKGRVQQARQEVARKKAATAATLQRRKQLEQTAQRQRHQVADLVASRRSAPASARRLRARDRATMHRLQRKEHGIEQKILARARRASNRRVADAGGMFSRPVPGYITSPFGWRIHPIYGYRDFHDGDDFHAPCGTPERAVGSGRVLSEYYSSVWGHRLYLGLGRINGHSYVGIYNHISSYRVGPGARVGRGETLAYAGTTGWSTGCHLHFTLMRDGQAVNPMNYFGG